MKEGKAKPKAKRLWSDNKALLLIKYLKIEEPLYNTKSEKYRIKDEKTKSLEKITVKLHGDGINDVNEGTINKKMDPSEATMFLKKGKRRPPKVVELTHGKFTQALERL